MLGEIYPTKFVNYLGSITTLMYGCFNFATIKLYPTLVTLGHFQMIYIYTSVCFISTLFIVIALPETLGKSKSEIEKQF